MSTIDTRTLLKLHGGVVEGKDFAQRMQEGMTREESLRVLNDLKTQLTDKNGKAKGGILRLMNASDTRGNVSKTMLFERKNALQGSRYFSSESRERTAQALKILFSNAGLSTRELDAHLAAAGNKAGGKGFLKLLSSELSKTELLANSDIDITRVSERADQLLKDAALTTKRADIADLIPRFNTLKSDLNRYVDYVDQKQEGQPQLAQLTRPVQEAAQKIAAAEAALAALGDIRGEAADQLGQTVRLINQADAQIDLLQAQYESRQEAAPIHQKLMDLRSQIRSQLGQVNQQPGLMQEDKDGLTGLTNAVLDRIQQLCDQIASDYKEFIADPKQDWAKFSNLARNQAQERLLDLAKQANELRSLHCGLMLRLTDPKLDDDEKNRLVEENKELNKKSKEIGQKAKAERSLLQDLRGEWPGSRWRNMPYSLRVSPLAQQELDAAVAKILERDAKYVNGASDLFIQRRVETTRAITQFSKLLSDDATRGHAAAFVSERLGEPKHAAAVGAIVARKFEGNVDQVAAFVNDALGDEADVEGRFLFEMLSGAFPPGENARFGEFSADFHACVRVLIESSPTLGNVLTQWMSTACAGLVAPASGKLPDAEVIRQVVTVRESEAVKLTGLVARDAVISLSGKSYDFSNAQLERCAVVIQLDPRVHQQAGVEFRGVNLQQWPQTSLSFAFNDRTDDGERLPGGQWNATLVTAGNMVVGLSEDSGEQARRLILQLIDFAGERNTFSIGAAVVLAATKFSEVAADASITQWVEEMGGADRLLAKSYDDETTRNYSLSVRRSKLRQGELNETESYQALTTFHELSRDPETIGAVLQRPEGAMVLAKVATGLRGQARSAFIKSLGNPPLGERTQSLRQLLTWSKQSPVLEPGAIGPQANPESIEKFVSVLERVAGEAPFLFGQYDDVHVIADLLHWREQLKSEDPLRARIDAVEQAVLHAPRLIADIKLPGAVDFLPALEQMSYGYQEGGKWVWTTPHYLVTTGKKDEDGPLYLLVEAENYARMGTHPAAVDWGKVHVLRAKPISEQDDGGPVKFQIDQLGGALRAEKLESLASVLPVAQKAMLSGNREFLGRLFDHLEIPESLRILLAQGMKGIYTASNSADDGSLGVSVDSAMSLCVENWVTAEGKLSDDHLTSLRTWASQQGIVSDDRQFAMFLFNLSASVTRLSSAGALGSQDASVGSLRQYGHLLFKQCRSEIEKVIEERPQILAGKAAKVYLNEVDLLFKSDQCSELLSTPMMDIGANMNTASYLRTVPMRFMTQERAAELRRILAGDEGANRAADEAVVSKQDTQESFPPHVDTIREQDDANEAQGRDVPSLNRIFETFNLASRFVAQKDYVGFVTATRRGIDDYQRYVNAFGMAPDWQYQHLPTNKRQAEAEKAGLTIGVKDFSDEQQPRFGNDGGYLAYQHTPHSWLVDQADENYAKLFLADAGAAQPGLMGYEQIGERQQEYTQLVAAIKKAHGLLPSLENWEGPLPARLEDIRQQRTAMLTQRVGQEMEQLRQLLPDLIGSIRDIELARAEIEHRDELLGSAIAANESALSAMAPQNPRRAILEREIGFLNAHRPVLDRHRQSLAVPGLTQFEAGLRKDLDFLGRLNLLPEPEPELEPEQAEDMAV